MNKRLHQLLNPSAVTHPQWMRLNVDNFPCTCYCCCEQWRSTEEKCSKYFMKEPEGSESTTGALGPGAVQLSSAGMFENGEDIATADKMPESTVGAETEQREKYRIPTEGMLAMVSF